MLEKLKKIINRLFYIVAGMRLYTSLMPTNINRYRRYTTRIKIKSFEYDRLVFKSDQEKVGSDIQKAVNSLK